MRPCQGRDDGATPFTRSILGGVAHQQSARLTYERQRGQHSSLPPFSEGIAQPVRADASHASGRRRESFCPHHFCPCGVVQPTRLSLKQEITGAKPVWDATFFALKALSAMHSLGKRISPVQFRVRDPFLVVRKDRSRASAQVGFISPLCPGRHRRLRPFLPPCSSLWIAFVKRPCRGSTGWRLHPLCSRSPMQRHDVENVASAGASPAASTIIGLQALK